MSDATINDLANELLLLIYCELPLQALIVARGVNRKWRSLVAAADIHPTRRKLLELYARAIASPAFIHTRPDIAQHLQPFDRQTYVDGLERMTGRQLPDEFRIWILEWP